MNEEVKIEEQKTEELKIDEQKTVETKPQLPETPEKKKKNPIKIVAIILIVISISMIGIGAYFTYLSNPRKIVGSGIEKMTANFKNILFTTDENLKLGDNFTIESDVTLNIQSDLFTTPTTNPAPAPTLQQPTTADPTMQIYNKLLTNLGKTQNKIVLKQDKTNKKAFFSINSTYNNQNLLGAKYLIENSTEYYYVDGFLNTYVNNGSSNYFEALTEQTTNQDNIIYLYEFISNSLKNNLKEEYFIKEQETTKIFDQEKKMTKVILKIDNLKAREILKAILSDLKADKKATEILSGYYEDFSKTKIKDDAIIFEDGEYLTINSYADNLKYNIQKVEIMVVSKEEQVKAVYETDDVKSKLSLIDNDKLLGYLDITKSGENKYIFDIKDETGKSLGTIKAERTNQEKSIELDVSSEGSRIYASYNSKANNIKDKSYRLNDEITFKVVSENTNVINANIKMNSVVSRSVEIKEDISTAVLASTVTDADQMKLEQVFTNALTKLTN